MRYMLMVKETQADGRSWRALPLSEVWAHAAFVRELDRQLQAGGELVSDGQLAAPAQALLVRGGAAAQVTTAPFDAGREFLRGFWVVDCDGPARALDIAARLSGAPGPGGRPMNVPIEVRPLMNPPGLEM